MTCSGFDPEDDETDLTTDSARKGKDGKFMWKGKHLALTYPQVAQCTLDAFVEEIKRHCKSRGVPLAKLFVGRERHKDGGVHFHVYVNFIKKVQTRDVRLFDLQGYDPDKERELVFHPNWKTFPGKDTQKYVEIWLGYCMKEGEFFQDGFPENLFVFKHWKGFRNNMADLQAYKMAAIQQAARKPFPFKLPDGSEVKAPTNADLSKKRNWLIYGDPDAGKTRWFQQEFKGASVYMRTAGKDKYPFEASSYRGEQLICYDDCVPKLDEFIDVSNTYNVLTQTYSESRYTNNYWPMNQHRVIIWLMNPERLPAYAKPGDARYHIFKARFNFLRYDKSRMPQDPRHPYNWVCEEDVVSWGPAPPGAPVIRVE